MQLGLYYFLWYNVNVSLFSLHKFQVIHTGKVSTAWNPVSVEQFITTLGDRDAVWTLSLEELLSTEMCQTLLIKTCTAFALVLDSFAFSYFILLQVAHKILTTLHLHSRLVLQPNCICWHL